MNLKWLVTLLVLQWTAQQHVVASWASSASATGITSTLNLAQQLLQQHQQLADSSPASQNSTEIPVKLTKIAVLGERHSGTNFMKNFLKTNLPSMAVSDWFCDQKHKYQTPGKLCRHAERAQTIVVVMFRNPYDWALAMHRNCWCGEPGPNLADTAKVAALPFETFLSKRWMDNAHKPWTGSHHRTSCTNIMECRAFKHLNFLNMTRWTPHVEFVRHEDVVSPEQSLAWLQAFVSRHGLHEDKGFMPLDTYKGAGAPFDVKATLGRSVWFNPSLALQNETLRQQVELITRTMDKAIESLAGYKALDLTAL